MLITNESNIFRNEFQKSMKTTKNLYVASGYFGKSEVDQHHQRILKTCSNGGEVKLIHGMGSSEGLASKLKQKLITLNTDLIRINKDSGVFLSIPRYHGKMYIHDSSTANSVFIGSSNFSLSGFENNVEMNVQLTDANSYNDAINFFNRLLKQSIRIDKFIFPQKHIPKLNPVVTIPSNITAIPVSYEIPIRVKPKSGVNLFLSKGRLNSATGVYKPRHFYEIELTLPKGLWVAPMTNFVQNSTSKQTFEAITDTGDSFDIVFKRKTKDSNDKRSIFETGGDFMSSPRESLGKYIKGKLMQSGLLSYGHPVTDDILQYYGNESLKIRDLGNNKIYISF